MQHLNKIKHDIGLGIENKALSSVIEQNILNYKHSRKVMHTYSISSLPLIKNLVWRANTYRWMLESVCKYFATISNDLWHHRNPIYMCLIVCARRVVVECI